MEPKVSWPVMERACRMPMVAEELWMTAVTQRTEKKADDEAVCDLVHRFFQRAGRAVHQPVAHQAHAVEKQRQTVEQ